jgi:signal transduction histidine kinase
MLINKLGGDITCDSTIGEGSVFIVTLPKEVLGMNGVEGA